MRIYLAGRFEDRFRLRAYRDRLVMAGHVVTSTWLDQPEGISHENPEAPYREIAEKDFGEITSSDALIVDTESVAPRGGREVEVGYALAQGLPVYVRGPRRNVFHHLCSAIEEWATP